MPRSEYTIDNAVNWVIRVNEVYRPSWIFCDRGYGDYQIERLHIYGDQNPHTGLKNKVVGFQFKQNLDIIDPVTKETKKEPMKPFMVNQLVISFDRNRIILSPFDEILHKQLIDYRVDRISANGQPIYTSVNEHFVDALGLAHLAFVLKFPEFSQAIKVPTTGTKMEHITSTLGTKQANAALAEVTRPTVNPWRQRNYQQAGKGENERPGDYQQWVKVPLKAANPIKSHNNWGTRGRLSARTNRSMW